MRSLGVSICGGAGRWCAPRCSSPPVNVPAYSIRKGRSRAAQRLLLINATEIMLVVVVPVILATLGFAWWYRASNARASRSDGLSL